MTTTKKIMFLTVKFVMGIHPDYNLQSMEEHIQMNGTRTTANSEWMQDIQIDGTWIQHTFKG
jgi:hypothetical protein